MRPSADRDPFGEVLPDRTRDEDERGWGDDRDDDTGERQDDARLRREVPPHHA